MPPEEVRLRIGNLAKAVLISGQSYQDPRDALNEFVSNAADEYAVAGRRGERITVYLRRQGRHPLVAVDDSGRGMDPDRLRQMARSLFESSKSGDPRTLGEKAIGILAFQQLGGRCEVVSRPEGSDHTHRLRLQRGRATAQLELAEVNRARTTPGTTIYLSDLDPEVVRLLTRRKVVDYLRRRRSVALARGDYTIEVVQGRCSELVTAEPIDGVRLPLAPCPTLLGRVDFSLWLAARPDRHRRVAVVGRAGTSILDDLCELEEFRYPPWNSDQVGGQIIYEALSQAAGRRAILRDRDAFPAFQAAVRAVEPTVSRALERITRELDRALTDRISERVRVIFARVLRELADIDNPMRSWLGEAPGIGAAMAEPLEPPLDQLDPSAESAADGAGEDLFPLRRPGQAAEPPPPPAFPGRHQAELDHRRSRALPTIAADPAPGSSRSRFEPELGTVYYNDRHPDFLLVRDEEAALLDYLATLVAKEYVVYNHPRGGSDELGEEMVRMLVRVRRHLLRAGARPRQAGSAGRGRSRRVDETLSEAPAVTSPDD